MRVQRRVLVQRWWHLQRAAALERKGGFSRTNVTYQTTQQLHSRVFDRRNNLCACENLRINVQSSSIFNSQKRGNSTVPGGLVTQAHAILLQSATQNEKGGASTHTQG